MAVVNDLKTAGKNLKFGVGIYINYPQGVILEDDVQLNDYCWISLLPINKAEGLPDIPMAPILVIGQGVYIGRFAHISCAHSIEIGRKTIIGDRFFVADCYHGYADLNRPIKDQYMEVIGPVRIGEGSWIGIGVSVMPNVNIGRNCIIGANSVVTSDIPDYTIAAGVPARVIRTLK